MKMVKTSLLAVTAGVLISPALMAADINNPSSSRTYSNEQLSTAGASDIVTGDVLAVELGAEYAVDDIITLSFSGSALDGTTVPTSVTVPDGALSGITFGLLSADSDTALFRVTEIVPGVANSTVGVTVTFAAADDLEFDAQGVDAANTITVAFAAETGTGLPLDTGGGDDRSTDYIETDDQFEAEVATALDGVIDVNQDRERFVSGGVDVVSFNHIENGGFAPPAATPVDSDVLLEGDFSWVFDTDDVTAGIQPAAGVFVLTSVGGVCTGLTIAVDSVTYTCPAGTTSSTVTIDVDLNVDGNGDPAVLDATGFTVTVDFNFTGFSGASGSSQPVAAASAGAWTLNGFQSLLSYTPYGTGISQVIYLANRGSQAGDITVDYVDQDGNEGSLGVIGTLQPTSTLSIGPAIQAALPTALQNFGRIALTITVNVPACDAQINAQYNAGGNRAYTSSRDNCTQTGGSY